MTALPEVTVTPEERERALCVTIARLWKHVETLETRVAFLQELFEPEPLQEERNLSDATFH
jgi:hypothetical protein